MDQRVREQGSVGAHLGPLGRWHQDGLRSPKVEEAGVGEESFRPYAVLTSMKGEREG